MGFVLHNHTSKDGYHNIYYEFRYMGKTRKIPTGCKTLKSNWKNSRITKDTLAKQYNYRLAKIEDMANRYAAQGEVAYKKC